MGVILKNRRETFEHMDIRGIALSAEQNLTTQWADIMQQATIPTPTTQPAKNPKKVAAGKAAAQKTKEVWEEQKKALAKAEEKQNSHPIL